MRAILGAIVVAAAALRFWHLGTQSYWYDETVTVSVLRDGLGDVLHRLGDTESTPPLYYVAAWLWTRVTGLSEIGLRSLSAVAGLAVVPLAYLTGRQVSGRHAGLIAAGLVAANPLLVWYSQEARAYSLVACLSALTLLTAARALAEPTARRLGAWSAAAVALLLTHYFGVFVIVPEAALLAVTLTRRRRAVILAGVPWALVGLALIPLARHQEGDGRTAWINGLALGDRVEGIGREVFTGNTALISMSSPDPGTLVWIPALAAIVLALALVAVRRRRPSGLALVALAALLVPYALAYTSLDFFLDRNLIAAWPLLAVALAVPLARAAPAAVVALLTAVVAVCGASVCLAVATDAGLQRQDWRDAVRRIGRDDTPRAVYVQPAYARAPFPAYGVSLTGAPPGVGVREVIVIGTNAHPGAVADRLGAFTVVDRRTRGGVGFVRYRAPSLQRLDAATVAAGGNTLRYMPSAAARSWFARYTTLTGAWGRLAATAPGRVTAGAQADAPVRVRALVPVPPELPDAGRLAARLETAASAAAAYGAGADAARQTELRRAVAGLAIGRP